MKYQIIKNGQDDYMLKYKDKVINFHNDVEIVSELQNVNMLAKKRMIKELIKEGITLNELTKEIKKDGKTYYDNSNKDELIKAYTEEETLNLFKKGIQKMLGMDLLELMNDIGIETQEESEELSKKLGEILAGRFRG